MKNHKHNKVNSYQLSSYLLGLVLCLLVLFTGVKNFSNISQSLMSFQKDGFEKTAILMNLSYTENFYMKYPLINLNGWVSKVTGRTYINKVVKLNNGQLTEVVDRTKVTDQATRTIDFYEKLEDLGISFLYIQAPHKISKYDPQLPVGIEDYSNDNADRYLELVNKGGVPTLDLREEIQLENLDHYSLFFHTDHHWTPQAAFWAFGELMTYADENWNITVDSMYTDIASYTQEFYPDQVLGSAGKRVGIYFGGVDDFTLLYPSFDCNMSLSIPSKNVYRGGSFEEAILDRSQLEKVDYYELTPYDTYIGGEYPLVQHHNQNAPIQEKILVLKDSFVRPVQAYLSTCFQDVDVLDLRYYDSMSVMEYIEKTKPDRVIMMYNPYMLLEEKAYVFE